MQFRHLGATGLVVSRLSFGTSTFGGVGRFSLYGDTGVDEAATLVGQCLDHGVNLFDTSNMYSAGAAEEILGKALGARRDEALICTKVGLRTGPGPNETGASRHNLIHACEASLRRLGTDHIDILMVHHPDYHTPITETLSVLDDLVRSGKVRYTGASNFAGWQLMKGLAVSDQRNLERFCCHQIQYSLLGREVEFDLVPLSDCEGVGLWAWGPLASGFFSGKFRRGEQLPAGTRLGDNPERAAVPDWERAFGVLDTVELIARERNVPVSQVALNWLLAKQAVSSVLLGARSGGQLEQNLGAITWGLTSEEVTMLDQVSEPDLIYPYWAQRGLTEGPARAQPAPTVRASRR